MSPIRPGICLLQVVIELGENAIVQSQILIVLCGFIESRALHLAQQQNRIVGQPFPQIVVDARKQTLRVGMPGPPQVVRQLTQAIDTPRQIKVIEDTSMKLDHSGTIIPLIVPPHREK